MKKPYVKIAFVVVLFLLLVGFNNIKLETVNSFAVVNEKFNISSEVANTYSVEEKLKQKDFYLVRNLDNLQTVKFGKYEQDGNMQNGKEDIEWLVVTKNEKEALLLSKYILDCKPFSSVKGEKNFEGSYLYNWLNSYFYQEAFGDIDKNKTIIKDNIGLLKYDDIQKYFAVNDNKKENQQLGSDSTDYAFNVANNDEFNVDNLDIMTTLAPPPNVSDDCWYRNNHLYYIVDKNMSCAMVNADGTICFDDGDENLLCIGIRPAVWVKI